MQLTDSCPHGIIIGLLKYSGLRTDNKRDLKLTLCVLKVFPEGSVSQIVNSCPSFHFISKNG